ncbi:1311_t:CDS:1, partial [Dentiscutata heterogama]
EIRKLISDINSDNWDDTKPIVSKASKAIKDERQESEEAGDEIQSKDENQIKRIEVLFTELKDMLAKSTVYNPLYNEPTL